MVTSTKYPGLEVAVHVDDRPLQEAEFAVTTTFKPPFYPPHGVMISLIIDGSPVTSRCCRQDELFGRVFKMHALHQKIHGDWVTQKLH
ncbi:hypothetical protein GGP41_009473 [Bipolaris sorokiniana]|uniref:Uncharacterized protein n=1 Tax=Cochliobolus sativus TaxID=45130 RepID=A0A8H5Z8T8_COCSA|nr:hypothetical protein GGP41_009473 [Bipolaris sorokiniana]